MHRDHTFLHLYFPTFRLLIFLSFRRQKSFQDEEESFQKQKQWMREREVEEAHRNAFEKERREIIARKRDKEGFSEMSSILQA